MLSLLDDQQIPFEIFSDYEPALPRSVASSADTETSALPERIIHQSVVYADRFAVLVHYLSALRREILHQKPLEIALADEADAGAVLLRRVAEMMFGSNTADVGFID